MEFFKFTFNQEAKSEKTYKLSDLINVDIEEIDLYPEIDDTVPDYKRIYNQLKQHIFFEFNKKFRNNEKFVSLISEELGHKFLSTLKTIYRERLPFHKRNNYRKVDPRYLHLRYLNEEDEIDFTLNNDPENQFEKTVEKKVNLEVENLLNEVTTSKLIEIYIEYKIKYLIQQQEERIVNCCENSELDKLNLTFQYDYNKFDFSHNAFIDEVSYEIGETIYSRSTSITLEGLERIMGLRSSFTEVELWDISDLKRVSKIASGKPIFKSTTVLFQFRSLTESIYNDGPAVEEKKDQYRTKIFIAKKDVKEVNDIIDKIDYKVEYFGVELGLMNLLLSTFIMAKSSEFEAVKIQASNLIKRIWMGSQTNKTNKNKLKRLYYILKVLNNIKINTLDIPYHSDIKNSKLWDIQFEYLGDLELDHSKSEDKKIEDLFDDFYFYFKPGSWSKAFLEDKTFFAKIEKDIFKKTYINNRFFFRMFSYLIFLYRIENKNFRETKIRAINLFNKVIDYEFVGKYENDTSQIKSRLLKHFFVALKELIKRGWEIGIRNDRFEFLLNDFNEKITEKHFTPHDIRFLKQTFIKFKPPEELRVDMPIKENQRLISEKFSEQLSYYLEQSGKSQFGLAKDLKHVYQAEISLIKNKKKKSIGKEKYNELKNEIYSE